MPTVSPFMTSHNIPTKSPSPSPIAQSLSRAGLDDFIEKITWPGLIGLLFGTIPFYCLIAYCLKRLCTKSEKPDTIPHHEVFRHSNFWDTTEDTTTTEMPLMVGRRIREQGPFVDMERRALIENGGFVANRARGLTTTTVRNHNLEPPVNVKSDGSRGKTF